MRENNIKKKPASRIKYEKTHPVVSFRASQEDYDELMDFLKQNSLSIGDFFRISLKKQKVNYEEIRTEAYNNGYENGRDAGYDEGYNIGKKAGYNEGYKDGNKDGYREGYKKGHNDGYDKAFIDGKNKGFDEGYNIAKKKYCVWYFCDICGQLIIIKSNSVEHNFIIDCFRDYGWGHAGCHQQFVRPY